MQVSEVAWSDGDGVRRFAAVKEAVRAADEPWGHPILASRTAAALRHGKVAGLHTGSPGYARQMIDKGFQLVAVQSDAGYMEAEARRVVAAVGKANTAGQRSGPY